MDVGSGMPAGVGEQRGRYKPLAPAQLVGSWRAPKRGGAVDGDAGSRNRSSRSGGRRQRIRSSAGISAKDDDLLFEEQHAVLALSPAARARLQLASALATEPVPRRLPLRTSFSMSDANGRADGPEAAAPPADEDEWHESQPVHAGAEQVNSSVLASATKRRQLLERLRKQQERLQTQAGEVKQLLSQYNEATHHIDPQQQQQQQQQQNLSPQHSWTGSPTTTTNGSASVSRRLSKSPSPRRRRPARYSSSASRVGRRMPSTPPQPQRPPPRPAASSLSPSPSPSRTSLPTPTIVGQSRSIGRAAHDAQAGSESGYNTTAAGGEGHARKQELVRFVVATPTAAEDAREELYGAGADALRQWKSQVFQGARGKAVVNRSLAFRRRQLLSRTFGGWTLFHDGERKHEQARHDAVLFFRNHRFFSLWLRWRTHTRSGEIQRRSTSCALRFRRARGLRAFFGCLRDQTAERNAWYVARRFATAFAKRTALAAWCQYALRGRCENQLTDIGNAHYARRVLGQALMQWSNHTHRIPDWLHSSEEMAVVFYRRRRLGAALARLQTEAFSGRLDGDAMSTACAHKRRRDLSAALRRWTGRHIAEMEEQEFESECFAELKRWLRHRAFCRWRAWHALAVERRAIETRAEVEGRVHYLCRQLLRFWNEYASGRDGQRHHMVQAARHYRHHMHVRGWRRLQQRTRQLGEQRNKVHRAHAWWRNREARQVWDPWRARHRIVQLNRTMVEDAHQWWATRCQALAWQAFCRFRLKQRQSQDMLRQATRHRNSHLQHKAWQQLTTSLSQRRTRSMAHKMATRLRRRLLRRRAWMAWKANHEHCVHRKTLMRSALGRVGLMRVRTDVFPRWRELVDAHRREDVAKAMANAHTVRRCFLAWRVACEASPQLVARSVRADRERLWANGFRAWLSHHRRCEAGVLSASQGRVAHTRRGMRHALRAWLRFLDERMRAAARTRRADTRYRHSAGRRVFAVWRGAVATHRRESQDVLVSEGWLSAHARHHTLCTWSRFVQRAKWSRQSHEMATALRKGRALRRWRESLRAMRVMASVVARWRNDTAAKIFYAWVDYVYQRRHRGVSKSQGEVAWRRNTLRKGLQRFLDFAQTARLARQGQERAERFACFRGQAVGFYTLLENAEAGLKLLHRFPRVSQQQLQALFAKRAVRIWAQFTRSRKRQTEVFHVVQQDRDLSDMARGYSALQQYCSKRRATRRTMEAAVSHTNAWQQQQALLFWALWCREQRVKRARQYEMDLRWAVRKYRGATSSWTQWLIRRLFQRAVNGAGDRAFRLRAQRAVFDRLRRRALAQQRIRAHSRQAVHWWAERLVVKVFKAWTCEARAHLRRDRVCVAGAAPDAAVGPPLLPPTSAHRGPMSRSERDNLLPPYRSLEPYAQLATPSKVYPSASSLGPFTSASRGSASAQPARGHARRPPRSALSTSIARARHRHQDDRSLASTSSAGTPAGGGRAVHTERWLRPYAK